MVAEGCAKREPEMTEWRWKGRIHCRGSARVPNGSRGRRCGIESLKKADEYWDRRCGCGEKVGAR